MEDIIQKKLDELAQKEKEPKQENHKPKTVKQKDIDDHIRGQIQKQEKRGSEKKDDGENKDVDKKDKSKYGRERRRVRSTDGLKQKMYVDERFKKPDHAYRWFNDLPGRLARAEENDWVFVNNPELADQNAGGDTRIRVLAGADTTGKPYYAYLMEIPKEWYNKDQQEKMNKIAEIEEQIEGGAMEIQEQRATYGNKIKIQRR